MIKKKKQDWFLGSPPTAILLFLSWQKYFQNYQFFLQIAPKRIENILATSDPGNPPAMIVQSDHGARNSKKYPYTGYLEDYSVVITICRKEI